ncbi:MAG: type II toxin-antitoxin system VapC family toxin [Chromatiales bacterium]|nr:type II toxin-antitoxin system VapC family toxin [Chromatiales bacterium]MDX9767326.1 type II toxin-antitoxin system VapC family toxin [Ectothiorhodospiraceae bacterium]
MIALDTNVLARAIVAEANADRATLMQQRRAQALLSSGQDLFIPVTVVEELEWVLRGAYEMPRNEIADLFDDMLAVENMVMDRAAAVQQAVVWYRSGLDFSDALHLAQAGLCAGLATFDGRFAKEAKRLGLRPPVTAP